MLRDEMIEMGIAASMMAAHVYAQPPATVAQGNYECWGNGSPRLLLNFKVTGKDKYSDPDGQGRCSIGRALRDEEECARYAY